MRAGSDSGVSLAVLLVVDEEDVVEDTGVEVADRKTVELPFGNKAVAFTSMEMWLGVPLIKASVAFNSAATESLDDTGRIRNIAAEEGVSGQTVATGTWITVVGKTKDDIVGVIDGVVVVVAVAVAEKEVVGVVVTDVDTDAVNVGKGIASTPSPPTGRRGRFGCGWYFPSCSIKAKTGAARAR